MDHNITPKPQPVFRIRPGRNYRRTRMWMLEMRETGAPVFLCYSSSECFNVATALCASVIDGERERLTGRACLTAQMLDFHL